MFGQHKGLHRRIQNLLFGATLLGYDEFRAILLAHPQGIYKENIQLHPVMDKLWFYLDMCGVKQELLDTWIDKITQDYTSRNYRGLPIEKVEGAKIDGRPVVEHMEEQKRTLGELYQIQLSEKKKNEKFRQDIYAKMEQDKKEVFSFISAQFADLKNYIDVKFASFSSSQEIAHVSKKPRLSNGEEMTETQVAQGVHRELKDPPKPTGISDWSKVVSPSLDKELELFLFHWHLYDAENSYARTVPKKATVNKKTGKTNVCISSSDKNKKKRMVSFFVR